MTTRSVRTKLNCILWRQDWVYHWLSCIKSQYKWTVLNLVNTGITKVPIALVNSKKAACISNRNAKISQPVQPNKRKISKQYQNVQQYKDKLTIYMYSSITQVYVVLLWIKAPYKQDSSSDWTDLGGGGGGPPPPPRAPPPPPPVHALGPHPPKVQISQKKKKFFFP